MSRPPMADPDLHVFWHDDALLHDTGSGVFESPPSPLIEVSELHPENDAYPPIIPEPGDMKILGKVVEVRRVLE